MLGYRPSKDQLAFYVLLLVALSVSSSAGVTTDVVSAQVDAGVDGSDVSSGAGTAASPFQISSCAELQAIEYDLDADYVLAQDINCTGFDAGDGKGFWPIGDNSNLFTGSLDGAGHIVTGLIIDRPSDDRVGLFGVTQGALVTRIGLEGFVIRGRKRVGGLVGWLREGGIEESFVTGSVTGEQYVGGIAGRAQDGSISNSYAQVSLSCTKWDSKAKKTNANCGGIIGGVVHSVTYNSYGAGPLAPQHGATGGGGPETLVASFFDCKLTGGCGNTHPEGRPTAMLQDPSFYEAEGWDFANTWGFSPQMVHPCLQWQPTCSGGPGCSPDDPSCDGVDDDCDGAIDEDFLSVPTTCGVGACSAAGVTSCEGGQVVDSCTPGTPAPDDTTCDGIDEDCDEATDEDFVSTPTTCGQGACTATGATSCVDGTVEDSCVAGDGAANDPTCDGGDDDCDGAIDEDYVSRATACGVGACLATGVTSCVDGTEQDSCMPGTPATEDVTCNGIDDNCDGTVDSDFTPLSTTCGVGSCMATGTAMCVDGQVQDDCVPGTPASDDATCDNIDADCDGATDEDFPSQSTSCGLGACAATGATACVGGQVQDTCIPGPPALNDAVCDGLDEDCDGLLDEDHVSVPTSCGIGACASVGDLSCVGGLIVDTCSAGIPASDDASCDGIDDDCDGQADEDCCIAATCQDYNINCGSVDNGCGGTIDCGTCQGGETCGGGGVPNVCGSGLPPDPIEVAPQTNVGTGDFFQSYSFFVEGPNPIQTGGQADAIDPRRSAIVRGRILSTSGEPVSGVKVFVPEDPSLGQTASRADGQYDLMVNGGGLVTLQFDAVGYLPVQRTMSAPWEGFVNLDDVVMTTASDVATVVTFDSTESQVAQSRSVTDQDGTRQIAAYYPSGTQAVAVVDGQSVPLSSGTLRMTEYTVGDSGPQAMPALLPDNSLYTFAADLSFDEVGPLGSVTFNQTTYFYLDNFLGFAPGTAVPNGSYDYELKEWVAEADGLVVKVVGVTTDGLAEIDGTYDDPEDQTPASVADLALIGITDDERRVIAERYPVGTSFWRMPIDHLSPKDWNVAGVLVDPPVPDPPPRDGLAEPEQSDCEKGSIVQCQSRTLGERIPIAGTPYALHYSSASSQGNVAAGRTTVIVLPQDTPLGTQAVRLRVRVLGRTLVDELLPVGTETYFVEWDGRDAYGREWQGGAKLYYSVTFVQVPEYSLALLQEINSIEARSFGVPVCDPSPDEPCCLPVSDDYLVPWVIDVVPGRPAPAASPDFEGEVLLRSSNNNEFGGWTLSHYHRTNPATGALLLGTGQVYNGLEAPTVLAGRLSDNDYLTDVPTAVDEFNDIAWPEYIAVGPDGWVYFTRRGQGDLWRARRGDGLERAIDFALHGSCDVRALAVDRNGDVYAGCTTRKIVRFTEIGSGQWQSTLIAGGNLDPGAYWQNGEPLVNTNLFPTSIAFRDDGRLFFTLSQSGSTNHGASDRPYELVEYLPDGTGRIVPVEVGPAIDGGADNTLVSFYDGDRVGAFGGSVVRIHPDYSVEILSTPLKPDNTGKTRVGYAWESTEEFDPLMPRTAHADVAAMPNGDIYVSTFGRMFQFSHGMVRRVSFAGLPQDFAYDIGSSLQNALEDNPGGLTGYIAARTDGVLYVADVDLNRIYEFNTEPRGYLPSRSGTEAYHFADSGLHVRTSDPSTGATLVSHEHDSDGNLQRITDRNGHATTIDRPDSATIRFIAPTGPGGSTGEVTTVRLNQDGLIEEVENPRGARWSFDYSPQGLLTKMWDPRANEQGLRAGVPYSFEYERSSADPDAQWLLKRDTDPVGGEQTLGTSHSRIVDTHIGRLWCDDRVEYIIGYSVRDTTSTVTKTTKLGRQKQFETKQDRGSPREAQTSGAVVGLITTTRTEPNGWTETRTDPDPSGKTTVSWPGGISTYQMTSHRWLSAPAMERRTSSMQIEAVAGLYPRTSLEMSTEKASVSDLDAQQPGTPLLISETVATTSTPQNGEPRVSTVYYDGPTRTQTLTSAEGRTSTIARDIQSRVVEVKLPGQVPTLYNYTADGYLESTSRTNGSQVRRASFGYDPRGYVNLVQNKVSDTVTDEVATVNDPGGFATQTAVPGVLNIGSTPDITGMLSTLTPDGKPPHRLSYTLLGQQAQYASPAGTLSTDGTCPSGTQCWRYSSDRELDEITLPDGTIVDYAYHPTTGALESVKLPGHGTTSFGYDGVGRRTSAIAPTGGAMGFAWQSTLPIATSWSSAHTIPGVPGTVSVNGTVERFYNDFQELSELHVAGGVKTRLVRDKDGLVTDIVDVDGVFPALTLNRSQMDGHIDGTTLDTVTTTELLDTSETTPGFGDLLSLTANAGATDLYDASYTYDDRGRIRTWTESVQGGASVTRKFDYDAAGRLLSVHDISGGEPGTLLEEYAYDSNGNRQRASSTYPGAVPLSAELGVDLGCPDASGAAANDQDQLCQYGGSDYAYNTRGQLQSKSAGGVTTQYSYDGLGRLKRVTEPGMDIQYLHDALGRRIGKLRDGNLEKGWLYADALNPIAQLDGAGNLEATFIYGSRAHVPDAMVMTDGTVYRLITDHLGSVRLVVNAETGQVMQRIDYDAFGRVLNAVNPGFQPFGFAGGLYDPDSGLVRFGARDYDAHAGRWTAKDPILFGGGGSNLYVYVNSDPVNGFDPTGLCSEELLELLRDLLRGFESYGEGFGTALAHLAALAGFLGEDTQAYALDVNQVLGGAALAAYYFPEQAFDVLVEAIGARPGLAAGRAAAGVGTSASTTPFVGLSVTTLASYGSGVRAAQEGLPYVDILREAVLGD